MAGRHESGVTYLELIATTAILMILASAILPLARVGFTRRKEMELRRSLREVRNAVEQRAELLRTPPAPSTPGGGH